MSGFIIPTAAVERPPLVPLGIEWPFGFIATTSEARQVSYQGITHALIDLDLALTSFSDEGPISFAVRSDSWTVEYHMTFGEDGPVITPVGDDTDVFLPRGYVPLSSFLTEEGLTVFFEQEALLSPDGYVLQPDRARPRFSPDQLTVIDWDGVNIQKEIQGSDRDQDSIQYKATETLRSERDWDLVIDDHGSGEAADTVFIKRDDQTLHVCMVHCKGSSRGQRRCARRRYFYEVCGQAIKSYKARSEIDLILKKVLRRERKRQSAGRTGLVSRRGC